MLAGKQTNPQILKLTFSSCDPLTLYPRLHNPESLFLVLAFVVVPSGGSLRRLGCACSSYCALLRPLVFDHRRSSLALVVRYRAFWSMLSPSVVLALQVSSDFQLQDV